MIIRLTMVLMTTILLSGCMQHTVPVNSAPDSRKYVDESIKLSTRPIVHPYYLQTGDKIDIKFYYNKELNESVVIRPDGKISLQLVGEVHAVGLAPEKLRGALVKKYTGILRRPEVAVIVRSFSKQKIYVGGEVNKPGALAISGSMTALQAILQAGGFDQDAERRNIVVLRNSGTGTPEFITLNLRDHIGLVSLNSGKDNCNDCITDERFSMNPSADIFLKPFDIVYVPQTQIGKTADFFEQYFNKIVPIYRNMGLYFTYNLNSDSGIDIIK